jgi:tetratricopeptide (TPR) repeat protein
MKKRSIKIFFIGLLLFNCAYYNTLFNAKKSYNEGIKIIQSEPEKESHPNADKHFEQTIDKCWKLIELYSDKSKYADDALLYIIKSEYYLKNYPQAKSHVNQFILKYPESDLILEANLWYGKLLIQDEDIEEGKEKLNKVLTLTKDSRLRAEAYYELGNLAFINENYKEAIQFFEKALDEKVDKQYAAFINFNLGESYFHQKQYREAINQFKKVEKYSPSLDIEYRTNFNMGKSYAKLNEYENALTTFRKMLTAPRFKNFIPQIKTEIANTHYMRGNQEEAIILYKEVVNEKVSNPGTALASFSLGKIYEQDIQNLDSSVYYYGQVKKLYIKFDSVDVAEEKFLFLSELKKIKDNIKQDKYLILKIETDSYFKDSLYTAQFEDSILMAFGEGSSKKSKYADQTIQPTQAMLDTFEVDTSSLLFKLNIIELDSISTTLLDSIHVLDSLDLFDSDTMIASLEDSLTVISFYMYQKTPRIDDDKEKVERRKLPQIKEDLKNNQFHLAEYFLLNLADYDSALTYYHNFLTAYQDSILTPKALFSLYYIYSQDLYYNEVKRDSLAMIIVNEYPKSPFAKELQQNEDTSLYEDEVDLRAKRAEFMFMKAEQLYSDGEVDSALSAFKVIAELDTSLIWSAKAQYTRAWIYENDLQNTTKAIQEYEYLKGNYPNSDFTKVAAIKVKPVSDIITPEDSASFAKKITPTISATTDTVSSLDGGSQTTTDEILSSVPMISKTKEYREWRQKRIRQN